MKIYVDLVLFLNFVFDFMLLLTVSILLKRKVKIYRLMLGAFFGSLSTLLLFFRMTSLTLFIIKIFISIGMIIIGFGFHDRVYFLKNILYLYTSSILLGGFLYLLNIEFSYKNEGLIFFHNGLSINFIILIIISPIILYIYIKQNRSLKYNYSHYHNVVIYLSDEKITCTGYLDTGNKIVDPYFNRSILFINKKFIKNINDFNIMVPYQTIGNHGIIKCICPKKVEIDGHNFQVLIGISEELIRIDGVDCILPNIIQEGIC